VSEQQQPPTYRPAPAGSPAAPPQPAYRPAPVATVPPPKDAIRQPIRIEPVPETSFGLAIYGAPPTVSGPSIGSLVAGIASILVSMAVSCAALVELSATAEDSTTNPGSGALFGGAFAALAGFLGIAGIGLGLAGMRQTKRAALAADGAVSGRGMAIAGLVCGAVGLGIAACSLGIAVLVAVS
jgi:hypothetical protein